MKSKFMQSVIMAVVLSVFLIISYSLAGII